MALASEKGARVLGRILDIALAGARIARAWVFAEKMRRQDVVVRELDELGGLFKKLGQHLSSRPDLVGPDMARKLEALRDGRGHPPNAEEERKVRRRLDQEMRKLESVWCESLDESEEPSGPFADVDLEPIARGCVAYVFRARLIGNPETQVAVKVRVPGSGKTFRGDAKLLSLAAKFCGVAGRWVPRRLVSVPWEEMEGALSRFSEAIVAQTDLLEEAHNLNRFLEQLGLEDPDGRVPVPIFALSSSKFLVMQWLDGEPLDRAASTRSTEECVRLVESYLRVIERMVLRDGLLHGDLHPGNVLLGTDGRLVLLDAGIAVPLTEEMMSSCNRSVTRYLRRDWAGCAKLMYDESPSTSSDSPEQAVAKKTRLTHELSALEKDEWKGLVDFWGRLMRAFERSGVATDRAFDALGVALLGADALVRNLPQGEQVLFDHLARLRKDPDALAAILHKNPRASNHT